jgi:hypothetical protein
MSAIKLRNGGDLCSLTNSEGQALLMAYGTQAIIDIDGAPATLSYHATGPGNRAMFVGEAVRIDGELARQAVPDPRQAAVRQVRVQVTAGKRAEAFNGRWICQKQLAHVEGRPRR